MNIGKVKTEMKTNEKQNRIFKKKKTICKIINENNIKENIRINDLENENIENKDDNR